ncbi:chitin disaccharide deacetylase [Heyndrickxia sp. NPDC080065]|uniref:chitin disaccharide deacetylase n=1 Tax=Heyndrickxia sp. NPDC080065 TaxID=3390568 RepID=UPI003D079935
MSYLIINADDFGLSRGVNYGIIESHKNGIVTSTTLMVNMPAAEHAVNLVKNCPSLGVGVHLNLTAGKPIHTNVPSLINDRGYFHHNRDLLKKGNWMDLEKELRAQIEYFYTLGLEPTHIDTHHNIHANEPISSIVESISKEYVLPVRQLTNTNKSKQIPEFCSDFHKDNATYETLVSIFKRVQKSPIEMMCHPGFIDETLLNLSSYNLPRIRELSILIDNKTKEAVNKYDIQLKCYKTFCPSSFMDLR